MRFAFAVLALVAVGLVWVIRDDDRPFVVPALTGERLSEAECLLERLDTRWAVDGGEPTDSPSLGCEGGAPDPEVVQQSHRPGSVLPAGEVLSLTTTCRGKRCG